MSISELLKEIIQIINDIKTAVFNKMSVNKPSNAKELKFKDLPRHINALTTGNKTLFFYNEEHTYDIRMLNGQYVNMLNGQTIKEEEIEAPSSSSEEEASSYKITPYIVLGRAEQYYNIEITGFCYHYERDAPKKHVIIERYLFFSNDKYTVNGDVNIMHDPDTGEIRLYFDRYSFVSDDGEDQYKYDIVTQISTPRSTYITHNIIT